MKEWVIGKEREREAGGKGCPLVPDGKRCRCTQHVFSADVSQAHHSDGKVHLKGAPTNLTPAQHRECCFVKPTPGSFLLFFFKLKR